MQSKQWINSKLSVESFYSFLTDFLSTASPPQKLKKKKQNKLLKNRNYKAKNKASFFKSEN